jgi:hypothetical protein
MSNARDNIIKKRFPHYWLCADCAKKQGGELKDAMGITVLHGICKYCELPIEQMLIPWCDFNWPKEKSIDAAAKAGRD